MNELTHIARFYVVRRVNIVYGAQSLPRKER